MAHLAHTAAHKEIHRPDNGTQCQANNQTLADHKKEGYEYENRYIYPQLDHTSLTAIGRHNIPRKRNHCGIEDENKNSYLDDYRNIKGGAPWHQQTKQCVIDDRFTTPDEGKDGYGHQQSHDPFDQ